MSLETRRLAPLAGALVSLALLSAHARAAEPSFLTFESGPVRPLALSPDGTLLFACNIPDGRLEIFAVGPAGLTHSGSVPVGLEPVAVAARTNDEVWVVNHLSDSLSVVDVPTRRVVRTLLVGDEPRDLVFAGAGKSRAFVTTAHRGQHRTHASIAGVPGAGDPQLTTPGVPRADVWVFDTANLGTTVGGTPLRILSLFSDTPRALAVSPDGTKVYAAAFHSGNRSTAINEGGVCDGFAPATPCIVNGTPVPGGVAPPATNFEGQQAPEVGVIVQLDPGSGEWRDSIGRNWSAAVRFHLPDKDVFEIDVATLSETGFYAGVGTILFNMAVNPANGKIYVSNFESRNLTRFEGPGIAGGSTVQGHLAEARIAILSGGPAVVSRHLNKHLDYSILVSHPLFDPSVKDHSLTTPLDLAFSSDGTTLYVAAFGSDKVGVFPAAALENDSFDPVTLSPGHLDVPGGGPAGLALDETHGRLYVATRFDNGVAVLDLTTGAELERHALHNPEPAHVVAGRPFLYDAVETSANGEASCSSCHIFGDLDSLAWDLGDPDGEVTFNPIPKEAAFAAGLFPNINGTGNVNDFHPMKGPMTTQTLRGLARSGAMHWRGDRSNGFFGQDAFDEELSFNNFIVAFPGLVGRATQPSAVEMQAFTDFALDVVLPPNPVRALDNSLSTAEQNGRNFYFGPVSDGIGDCNFCHTLDPGSGFFGTDGRASFENESQIVKIPHLRNAYQKVGMFGMMSVPFIGPGDFSNQGDQVRGFGFLHDGAIDTLLRFFQATVFSFPGGDAQRRDVEAFVLAFDTDLAPIVGQQVTLTATNLASVQARIDLLLARAAASFDSALLGGSSRECDVVAKGVVDGEPRGWLFEVSTGRFRADRSAAPTLSKTELLALATVPGQELTFTAVPTGSGVRSGIDRDLDAVLDGDDNCPAVANPDQSDADADGVGDACDADFVAVPTNGQRACVDTMNKLGFQLARTQGTDVRRCIQNGQKGNGSKLGPVGMQTAQACLRNDVRGRVLANATRLAERDAAKCTAPDTPGFAYTGAAAMTAPATDTVLLLEERLFGADLDASLASNVAGDAGRDAKGARCQREIWTRSSKLFDELWRTTLAAKRNALRGRNRVTGGAADVPTTDADELAGEILAVLANDATGKIQRRVDALADRAQSVCGDPQISTPLVDLFPGACAAAAPGPLASCAAAAARCSFCRSLAAFDDLPLACDGFDDGAENGSCP